MALSAVILSLVSVQVQSGGCQSFAGIYHVFRRRSRSDSVSAPPSSSRGNYLATQSRVSYHSASSSPSVRSPSSGFDGVNEETNVVANDTVVHGHVNVRASAVMTNDNNDNVDDNNFDDTLSEILDTSSRVATSLDLDLVFGTVDVNVDLACTSLLFPLSHLPPPISSPPSSGTTGEPI